MAVASRYLGLAFFNQRRYTALPSPWMPDHPGPTRSLCAFYLRLWGASGGIPARNCPLLSLYDSTSSLMARTQALKLIIQPELAAGFLKGHSAIEITTGRVLGMEFDLVGYSNADRVLWFCEITASGFLGKGRGDFHVGASRKFCEGFAKFSVLKFNEREAKRNLQTVTNDPVILDAHIECRFVVPLGSRFIQALGWRGQLIGTMMRTEEIPLSESSRETMIQVLLEARREQERAPVVD